MSFFKTPSIELTGRIKAIGKTKQITDSFKVRSLWMSFDDSYVHNGEAVEKENTPEFQFKQSGCELLDNFSANDLVKITFKPEGRKWESNGKSGHITNLSAFKIEVIQAHTNGQSQPTEVHQQPKKQAEIVPTVEDLDNADPLPF